MNARIRGRRQFLTRTAKVVAAGWIGNAINGRREIAVAATASLRSIRLGCASTLKSPTDPEELAKTIRRQSYRAANCPTVGLTETEHIRDIERAFAKHDVMIAEVGRWKSLSDADPAKRAENLQYAIDGLALADAVGARCCVSIIGSLNSTEWHGQHRDDLLATSFDAAVENARKIIDAVKPRRTKFCYEILRRGIPNGPDSYLKLIKAVDRPAFAAHLDPCNIFNSSEQFHNNTDVLNECFDKLGPWIVSCHAKDLVLEPKKDLHFKEVRIGTGELDYATYLKRLAALPADVPLMMEHMHGEEYDQSREHLFNLAKKIGTSFE